MWERPEMAEAGVRKPPPKNYSNGEAEGMSQKDRQKK